MQGSYASTIAAVFGFSGFFADLDRRGTVMESMPPAPTKILLVEDQASFRLALPALLTRARPDFEIDAVATFAEALALCRDGGRGYYGCVLLDLCLGDMATERTIDSMRLLAEFSPVIVLTGRADEEALALECIHAGADNLMQKDELSQIGPERLIKQIHFAIARKERDERLKREREISRKALGEAGVIFDRVESGGSQEITRTVQNGKE